MDNETLPKSKSLNHWVAVIGGIGLVVAIGALDWVTGPSIPLGFLYLVPIFAVTWLAGRWPGTVMAVATAGAGLCDGQREG